MHTHRRRQNRKRGGGWFNSFRRKPKSTPLTVDKELDKDEYKKKCQELTKKIHETIVVKELLPEMDYISEINKEEYKKYFKKKTEGFIRDTYSYDDRLLLYDCIKGNIDRINYLIENSNIEASDNSNTEDITFVPVNDEYQSKIDELEKREDINKILSSQGGSTKKKRRHRRKKTKMRKMRK